MKMMTTKMVNTCAVMFAAATLVGCTPAIDAELGLIDQSRRGLALLKESADARQQVVDAYFAMRRQQLNDAFDADVNNHDGPLTPEWVQRARQAYSLAAESIASAEAASRDAARTSADNTDAVEQCLIELQTLNRAQRIFAPALAPALEKLK